MQRLITAQPSSMEATVSNHPSVTTVAMSAAFLAIGMKEHADFERACARYSESEEGGQIELVAALTSYAPIIATFFDNEERDFPGVFHYEVTEPFGAWFAESLCATGKLPGWIDGMVKLAEMIEAFFAQGCNQDPMQEKTSVTRAVNYQIGSPV